MRDGGWWWMGEEEFSPHSISYLWFRVKTFLWIFASCDGWWMVDSGGGWSKKCSLISLKLGTLVVQDKIMCENFKFSDFDQKMLKKFQFKFEIWEKIYKGFPHKKIFLWELLVK